jgi:hypothetical protein
MLLSVCTVYGAALILSADERGWWDWSMAAAVAPRQTPLTVSEKVPGVSGWPRAEQAFCRGAFELKEQGSRAIDVRMVVKDGGLGRSRRARLVIRS